MTLSKEQKRMIAMAAHAAWAVSPDREGMIECNGELSLSAIEAAWRHHQQGLVLGLPRQSLTEAHQGDFAPLLAHFSALAGREAAADNWAARAATDGPRRARWILERELKARGLSTGYAAAICRTQNKCVLDDASEKQLWRLVFTVRNRRKAAA